jgi:hypothetical protein
MEVTNVIDHEDGSADIEFDMTEDEQKAFVSLGLKYTLVFAAYQLSWEEVYELVKTHGKILPGTSSDT